MTSYSRTRHSLNAESLAILPEIPINDDCIGIIPYMSGSRGPMYDTSKQRALAYDRVYQRFEHAILDKIVEQEPLAKAFHMREDVLIDVMDGEGNRINTAFLEYLDNEWTVSLTGLDPVEETQSITVEIIAPPPPNA
jgi:hypothetical protein